MRLVGQLDTPVNSLRRRTGQTLASSEEQLSRLFGVRQRAQSSIEEGVFGKRRQGLSDDFCPSSNHEALVSEKTGEFPSEAIRITPWHRDFRQQVIVPEWEVAPEQSEEPSKIPLNPSLAQLMIAEWHHRLSWL